MTAHRLPPITLSFDEADRLSELADATSRANPELSAFLEREISRAAIVEARKVPANVVRIGSHVTFRDSDGTIAEVTLVLPGDADVNQGKVSVLTPVGAALIGMKAGQTISFAARRGTRQITVLTVDGSPVGAAVNRSDS